MFSLLAYVIHKYRIWRYNQRIKSLPERHPVYEKYFIVSGDIVVDVGACIGEFTLIAAKRASKVIAIEPEPTNFKLLSENVARLKLANIILVNKALSNYIGKAKLFIAINPLSHTLHPEATLSHKYKVVEVEVTTLDKLMEDLGIDRVDFVKIDAEGSEIEILEGAIETLKKARKIVIEYHNEKHLSIIRQFLNMLGYERILCDDRHIYAQKLG